MATVDEIVDAVYVELSMASGINTQIYSDDKVLQKLQHHHDSIFSRLWWPQYMTYGEVMPLDGTTGKVTTTLTAKIKKWFDVQAVFYESEPSKLPKLPDNINPAVIRRKCIAPVNDNKIFKVVPITTTGNVTVNYRTAPATFVAGSVEVNMDKLLLVHAIVADMLMSDGTNPEDAQKYNAMFGNRFAEFERLFHNHGIPLDVNNQSIPTEWQG